MKNLKKSLALVLALVMVFSLVVFANAEFNDAEDINPKYTDAVGVMNGLGIIKGYDNGNFGPQDTLKRDQAAKIVAILKMGPASSTLPSNQVFPDVPADHWAAPFVAYCNSKNIINGYDNGNFGPGDDLIGFAFTKMLLVALGYGQNGEFVGPDWSIHVSEKVADIGLFDAALANEALTNNTITREVAAQMAFKALGATMVDYEKSNDIYKENGKTLAANVQDLDIAPWNVTDAEGRPVKAYYKLSDIVMNPGPDAIEGTADDYPEPKLGATPVYSTTGEAGYTTDAGFKAAVNANKDWVKGTTYPFLDSAIPVKLNEVASDIATISLEDTTHFSYAGATMEFFYGLPSADGKIPIKSITVTDYTFAPVTAVVEGKSVTLGTNPPLTDKVSLKALEGVAVGDKLAVVLKGSVVIKAEKATAVTGEKVTARNTTTRTFKIDGTEYKADWKLSAIPAIDKVNGTYYANPNGYIFAFEPASGEVAQTNFVYIAKLQAQASSSGDMINPGSGAVVKAEAIFADGTHKTIDLTITAGKYTQPKADGTVAADIAVADITTPADIGNWFAYTEASDGSYTLAKIVDTYAKLAGDVNLTEGAAKQVVSKYTNSSMKIVSIDYKFGVTEKTGLVAASLVGNVAAVTTPATEAHPAYPNAVLATYAKDSSTIAAIYAVGQALPASAPVTKTYARAIVKGNEVADGFEWSFYIDGKVETYVISGSVTEGEVYTLTKDTTKDVYTAAAETKVETAAAVTLVDAAFVVAGGNTYNIGEKTVIFDVREGHTGETGTLAAGLKVDIVEVLPSTTPNKTAAVIYIVD